LQVDLVKISLDMIQKSVTMCNMTKNLKKAAERLRSEALKVTEVPGIRNERVQERRKQLLGAAKRAIRKAGAQASMDYIAKEAGINRPILYRYFQDKDGLTRALAKEFSDELFAEFEKTISNTNRNDDLRIVAYELIDTFFSYIEKDPNVYRFLVHRALYEDAKVREPLEGFIDIIGRRLSVLIGDLLRSQNRDSGPAELWAFSLVGMVHLAGEWWLRRQVLQRETVVGYITALASDGFLNADKPVERAKKEHLDLKLIYQRREN
jgi:AcrR family transcriptional regulator